MKTDLAKILSVSGHHGLFLFLAQSRTGAIAEALSDKNVQHLMLTAAYPPFPI